MKFSALALLFCSSMLANFAFATFLRADTVADCYLKCGEGKDAGDAKKIEECQSGCISGTARSSEQFILVMFSCISYLHCSSPTCIRAQLKPTLPWQTVVLNAPRSLRKSTMTKKSFNSLHSENPQPLDPATRVTKRLKCPSSITSGSGPKIHHLHQKLISSFVRSNL